MFNTLLINNMVLKCWNGQSNVEHVEQVSKQVFCFLVLSRFAKHWRPKPTKADEWKTSAHSRFGRQYHSNHNLLSQNHHHLLSQNTVVYQHCCYQEKWIFPRYNAKLNLTLSPLQTLYPWQKIILVVHVSWLVSIAGGFWCLLVFFMIFGDFWWFPLHITSAKWVLGGV